MLFKPELGSKFQVDASSINSSVSPLSLGRGGRERIFMLFKPELGSEFQVDASSLNSSVSPLSLGRGLG
ncbi:Uncharacterised protein [Pseudomonas fluorescens]|uniref:Uncharacterized protein n=1 Tax=Pseudomonas fluorescens TaxID=294 RepID=A0A448DIT1_PSEFL|nr:Uncharacterised protein [Pseudomonas fluorescens]